MCCRVMNIRNYELAKGGSKYFVIDVEDDDNDDDDNNDNNNNNNNNNNFSAM
jgi:hypothetical protein